MAAVLAGGEGAVLAGLSAALLHEITRWKEREIDVLVPKQRRAQAGFRLRTCRHLDRRDVTVVNGIPVTTVARTAVDLTEVMDADEVAFVIHEAVYRKRFDLERHARRDGTGERTAADQGAARRRCGST